MEPDQAAGIIDDEVCSCRPVTTNLLGPIRLTSALVDQLKSRRGVILYNTSVLAFVPLAVTAVYSATKAALHFLCAVATLLASRQRCSSARGGATLGADGTDE